ARGYWSKPHFSNPYPSIQAESSPYINYVTALEDQLQSELNLPRRESAGDLAECAGVIAIRVKPDVRRVAVRRCKVGVVEEIESFHAEFKLSVLFPHRERFVQAEVRLEEARAADDVAPRIAERFGAVGRHGHGVEV